MGRGFYSCEKAKLALESGLEKLTISCDFRFQTREQDLEEFWRELETNETCKSLWITSSNVNLMTLDYLSDVLKANKRLRTLLIKTTMIEDNSVPVLCNALKINETLVKLHLEETGIGESGAIAIASALQSNFHLQKLDLRRNKINGEGGAAIAGSLQYNKSLVYLCMGNNEIGDNGARAFSNMLKCNRAIGTLLLYDNKIGDPGASALGNSLRHNDSLTSLSLRGNPIGDEGVSTIAAALRQNNTLLNLRLSKTNVTTVGARKLAKTVRINSSLTKLALENTNIGLTGAAALRDAIKENEDCALISLLLDPSPVSSEIKRQLLYTVKKKFSDAFTNNKRAPLNRIRLMVVGQGKAGKSATVRSLLQKSFVLDWNSTIGADISIGVSSKRGWTGKEITGDNASRFAAYLIARGDGNKLMVNENAGENRNTSRKKSIRKSLRRSLKARSLKRSIYALEVDDALAEDREEISSQISRTDSNDSVVEPTWERSNGTLISEARKNGSAVTFAIWDFGGQEVFYAMHHIFLTKTGIYLLVFDLRGFRDFDSRKESVKYLQFWLRSIRLHAPQAPLFLVGTFLGEMDASNGMLKNIDDVLRELVKGFPQVINGLEYMFFPIDNRDRIGINRLRQSIEECTRSNETIRQEVSLKWMAFLDTVMERSNAKGASYLKVSESLQNVTSEVGEMSLGEQREALSFFHQRGFLIYLTASEILRNLVVVKPEWLVKSIGKVIRDPTIHIDFKEFKNAGLLQEAKETFEHARVSRDMLDYLWERDQVEFLIDFMKRTMLMSEWKKREVYLIPSLLGRKLAVGEIEIQGRRFWFDFQDSLLAKGVFQRLVCLCVEYCSRKMQNLDVNESLYYENYACLKFGSGSTVHLLEDETKQSITLIVDGPTGKIPYIVESMLIKINSEFMGAGLRWDSFGEDESKKVVRLHEVNDSTTIKQKTLANIDLFGFLDGLDQ